MSAFDILDACLQNDLKKVKFLYNKFNDVEDALLSYEYIRGFYESCKRCHIDIVRWFLSTEFQDNFKIIETSLTQAFCTACENSNVEIAKLIYSLYPNKCLINISSFWDAFQTCCLSSYSVRYGETLKFMISIINTTGMKWNDTMFFRSLFAGNVEVMKILLAERKFTSTTINEIIRRNINNMVLCVSVYLSDDITKVLFEYGYVPEDTIFKEKYCEYLNKKHEIKTHASNYVIPELAALIYRFV